MASISPLIQRVTRHRYGNHVMQKFFKMAPLEAPEWAGAPKRSTLDSDAVATLKACQSFYTIREASRHKAYDLKQDSAQEV